MTGVKVRSQEARELDSLIHFWKDSLAEHRLLMSPSTIYLVEQTINRLEELRHTKGPIMTSMAKLGNEIRRNGYIATLRRARKRHICRECRQPIEPGQEYYEVIRGGGGLGWHKYPKRCHLACLEGICDE